ncbi:hypothetical protein HAX54_017751 [Datura stramonium]|uniref:EF-hand domain-containing protein n=1 Tax=Datura stramonium TaxID=4076 RepID=A0ABS8S0V7_DATST|nr:hypothetical protein [Datura stramonium]
MKLIKNLPKKLFKYKKSRSISKSDDPSFSSGTTSSSSSENSHHKPNNNGGLSTPTSVLPTLSNEISADEWSEISAAGVYSDLVQAFSVIDRDGDGKISKEQLETILSRVGGKSPPSEEELMLLLDEIDKNGDGCISLDDFVTISSAFEPQEEVSTELKDTFDFFDEDHDGKITAQELLNVFRMIGDARCTLEECRHMIESVDKNGDGFVCFEDFCLMMEHQK